MVDLSAPFTTQMTTATLAGTVANIVNVVDIHKKIILDGVCHYYVTTVQSDGTLTKGAIYVNAILKIPKECKKVDISVLGAVVGKVSDLDISGTITLSKETAQTIDRLRVSKFASAILDTAIVTNVNSSLQFKWADAALFNETIVNYFNTPKAAQTIGIDVNEYLSATVATPIFGYFLYDNREVRIPKHLLQDQKKQSSLVEYIYDAAERRTGEFLPYMIGGNYLQLSFQANVYKTAISNDSVDATIAFDSGRVLFWHWTAQEAFRVDCLYFFDLDTKQCENLCDAPKISFVDKLCYDEKHNGGVCFGSYYKLENKCFTTIPTQLGVRKNTGLNLARCLPNLALDTGVCHTATTCPVNYFKYKSGCFYKCPEGSVTSDAICNDPSNVTKCLVGEYFYPAFNGIPARCLKIKCYYPFIVKSNRECIASCDVDIKAQPETDAIKGDVNIICQSTCTLGFVQQKYVTIAGADSIGERCLKECSANYANIDGICIAIDKTGVTKNQCKESRMMDLDIRSCVICGTFNGQYWVRNGVNGKECQDKCDYYNISISDIKNIVQNCEDVNDNINCPVHYVEKGLTLCAKVCPQTHLYKNQTTCYQRCDFYNPIVGTQYFQCVDSCPNFKEPTPGGMKCVDVCSSGNANPETKECLGNCKSQNKYLTTDNTCVLKENCPLYTSEDGDEFICTEVCTSGAVNEERNCTNGCKNLFYYDDKANKICVTTCPATLIQISPTQCEKSCPSDKPHYDSIQKQCVNDCKFVIQKYEYFQCTTQCTEPFYKMVGTAKQCIANCAVLKIKVSGEDKLLCADSCLQVSKHPHYDPATQSCVAGCSSYYSRDMTQCQSSCENKYVNNDGKKVCGYEKCPPNYVENGLECSMNAVVKKGVEWYYILPPVVVGLVLIFVPLGLFLYSCAQKKKYQHLQEQGPRSTLLGNSQQTLVQSQGSGQLDNRSKLIGI